jgi:hypothetical protein
MLPRVFIKDYQIYEHLNYFKEGGNKSQMPIGGRNDATFNVIFVFSF